MAQLQLGEIPGSPPYSVVVRESTEGSGNRVISPTIISTSNYGTVINFNEISDGAPHSYKVLLTDSTSAVYEANTNGPMTCGTAPTPIPVSPTPVPSPAPSAPSPVPVAPTPVPVAPTPVPVTPVCNCVQFLFTPTGNGPEDTWTVNYTDCGGVPRSESGNGLDSPRYKCGCSSTVSITGDVLVTTEGTCGVSPTPVPVTPTPVPVSPSPVPVSPTPVPVTPTACNCISYTVGAVLSSWSVNYTDCSGNSQVSANSGGQFNTICACQGSVSAVSGSPSIDSNGSCGGSPVPVSPTPVPISPSPVPVAPTPVPVTPTACNCVSYTVGSVLNNWSVNYTDCSGNNQVSANSGGNFNTICACEGSVSQVSGNPSIDSNGSCGGSPVPIAPSPAPVSPTPTPVPVSPSPAPVSPSPVPVAPTPAPVSPTPVACQDCRQFVIDPTGDSVNDVWSVSFTNCDGNQDGRSGSGIDTFSTFCACNGTVNLFGWATVGQAGNCGSSYTPPLANNDYTGTQALGVAYNWNIYSNDTACQSPDTSTWEIYGSPINCTVSLASNGVATITPTSTGPFSFQYRIRCGNGIYSNIANVYGTVPTPAPFNPPPASPVPSPAPNPAPISPACGCRTGTIASGGSYSYTDCNNLDPQGYGSFFSGAAEAGTEICFVPERFLPPSYAAGHPTVNILEGVEPVNCNCSQPPPTSPVPVTPVPETPVPVAPAIQQ